MKLLSALSLAPLAGALQGLRATGKTRSDQDTPNFIILLLDALSAQHLPIYGYPRDTAEHITRFAERSLVYHSHYAAGNYTISGTASLLTGTYPWTHRAFSFAPQVKKNFADRNIFQALGAGYQRAGYSQNIYADLLLRQFENGLDTLTDLGAFSAIDRTVFNHLTPNDAFLGFKSFDDFLFKRGEKPGSLFLSFANEISILAQRSVIEENIAYRSPLGLPHSVSYHQHYLLEPVFAGVADLLTGLTGPFMAYMHLYPPHEPYYPNRENYLRFEQDGWAPPFKPEHHFNENYSQRRLNRLRARYDEYLASADTLFGELIGKLEAVGLLENSYVIVTADHGQMFERGIHGHTAEALYDPVVRVPLIVYNPTRRQAADIHTPTNCVDLLPTLLHLSGQPAPDWCEGQALPGLGGPESPDRPVYTMDAKRNASHRPLERATVALIKDGFKLIKTFGHPGYKEIFELYNLSEDAEELVDLYPGRLTVAKALQDELETKIYEVNQPYL